MIIRHREKPDENSPNPDCRLGYSDKNYQHEDKSGLTKQGWNNALALVRVFSTPTDPLIQSPRTIFASAKQPDKSDRERLTVEPLAAKLLLKINDHFAAGQEEELFDAATKAPGPILICWHHSSIFDIGKLFRAKEQIPSKWENEDFDGVWAFISENDRWHFKRTHQGLDDLQCSKRG